MRRRDVRRSRTSRTFRSARPACAARPVMSRCFEASIGSFAGIDNVIAPSSSPWWVTARRVHVLTERRQLVPDDPVVRGCREVGRPRRHDGEFPIVQEPDAYLGRARARGEQLRHPWKDVVDRVRLTEPFGELRKHLERGRPFPVDDAIGDRAGLSPHRIEGQDEHHRGDERAEGAHRGERERGEVEHRDERRDDREHDRPLHDDVEVVQAVLQDRDRAGKGDPETQAHEEPDEGDGVDRS